MVRGETVLIDVTVVDSTGATVDLTTVDGLLIGIYQNASNILDKFSKVAKAGFKDIDLTQGATGIATVAFEATENINIKELKIEVKVSQTSGAFIGGYQTNIDTNITLENVEASIFEGVQAQ